MQVLHDSCTHLQQKVKLAAMESSEQSFAKSIKELQKLGLGGPDGALWRASLTKTATYKEVLEKARATILDEAWGRKLQAAFKVANQDCIIVWGR